MAGMRGAFGRCVGDRDGAGRRGVRWGSDEAAGMSTTAVGGAAVTSAATGPPTTELTTTTSTSTTTTMPTTTSTTSATASPTTVPEPGCLEASSTSGIAGGSPVTEVA